MSAYGRWREAEEKKFEAWWKQFLANGWLVHYTTTDREPVKDEREIALAHTAAINAWMKSKEHEAPDD
jgi:hypothetical protein